MTNKKTPKVSIIVPVYNADLYLEKCLNSLVNQTLQDIEIICVNDNSKDKSLKILQKFAKNDNRIKIINFKETNGQSKARNIAIESVSGEYIGFVDADDFVDIDMFEKMYKKAQKSDMVMCQTKVFDEKVQSYKDDAYFALDCFDDKFTEKPFNHEDTKDFITEINVSVWNKIYRTEFLKKCGVKFQEGFIYEDLPYFYEVYTLAKKVVLLKEFLYTYRINNKNSTMTRTDKNVKDRVDMASQTYDVLKKQKYFSEIKSNVVNAIIHDLFYRYLIIDSRYQKEYFFRMQKFFKMIDTTDIDDTLIKSVYYPYFCEIKKRSYDETIKYFSNQETLGSAYVEHAKLIFKRDFEKLNAQKQEFLETKDFQLAEIERQRLICEKEKSENEKNKNDLTISKQNLDNSWADFEKIKAEKLAELDKLQERILQDEKIRWSKFEQKEKDLNKLEDELWQKVNTRQEELKKAEYELEKAWEKFKIDNLKREKELDKKQSDILYDEKERWKKYELKVADLEHQKEEFKKEKDFKDSEIAHQWEDFEKERELQLCELDRKHKLEKLTVEKMKNYLANRYLEDVESEKSKLASDFAEESEKQQAYYSDLLEKQLKMQEENYKKTDIFKKKMKEETMQRPKVSIILPVYNVAPYLRQSLDSIIGQTLKDIEIICVDDGSTDESGKILDEYKEKDSRIKVIHKKNAGTGAARNDGLKIATGECIGFVDPDDWILPNMYERLYNILQEKELDIVMFTPDVFNDQTQKHEGFLYFQDSNFPKFLDDKIFNKDDISPFSYPMCVWNKLYRKKLFDDNNIDFAEGLDFEDHKVIFKSLFTAKRIYFIREKLYVYRHSRQGSILSDNDTRMFDHIKIYDIVENILKETGNWEKFHLDFLRYKVHNILYYYTMIKPQYKDEYYKKMVKSLQSTKMSQDELSVLEKDYPDLKPIMEDTLSHKIKRAVNKIIKRK